MNFTKELLKIAKNNEIKVSETYEVFRSNIFDFSSECYEFPPNSHIEFIDEELNTTYGVITGDFNAFVYKIGDCWLIDTEDENTLKIIKADTILHSNGVYIC